MDQQTPKWIIEARKMISGRDNRVKDYWDSLSESKRRSWCFISDLKNPHVLLSWAELKEEEKAALWRGVLVIRKLHEQTRLFTQQEFKSEAVFNLSDRANRLAEQVDQLVQRIDSETKNSMH
ncbi:hypothetical protein [Rahnella inusitata]|uniref:hypothetical protein n=1 Tax=Rahnella inusitata TaxID=58169 RepID=UPI001BC82C1B|nr:hypothetical protein [Rahnella inusitata]QUT16148.1 hypothetical protein I2123_04855 [Rahnella inusitata]